MEIRVRNVEPSVISEIDELAIKFGFVRKNGKAYREEFLRWHFKQLAIAREVKEIENANSNQIELLKEILVLQHRDIMERIEELEQKLMENKNGSEV